MTEPILYERTQFPYAMSLVSPPILLQTRVGKSHVCNNHLGSAYQKKIWADTTNGGERSRKRDADREKEQKREQERERPEVAYALYRGVD